MDRNLFSYFFMKKSNVIEEFPENIKTYLIERKFYPKERKYQSRRDTKIRGYIRNGIIKVLNISTGGMKIFHFRNENFSIGDSCLIQIGEEFLVDAEIVWKNEQNQLGLKVLPTSQSSWEQFYRKVA